MRELTNITVILPIHQIGENEISYLESAIKSLVTQKVSFEELLIVTPKGLDTNTINESIKKIDEEGVITYRYLENEGETDFCSQINFGVTEVKTDFFSIMEVDDQYSNIWFDNVSKYQGFYPDVDVFLPLVLDVNIEGKFLHFTNEPVWAKDFSDKQGFLDNDSLLNYPNFQLSGSVIRKESFQSVGGLKPTLKQQFVYEFLLRMSYYDKKMMTIPKVGYRKVNMRPGSLFYSYRQGETKIDPVEARFWFQTARKESYFKTDRGIKYVKEES